MVMLWALFVLPFAFASGGDLNVFLQIHPGSPITVHCGNATFNAYVYSSGGSVTAMILYGKSGPIFSPKIYFPAAHALLYKMDISKKFANVRILRTDVAASLQSLATVLANEEYSYALARKSLQKCAPQYVSNVDSLDALRKKSIQDILRVAPVLQREAKSLASYVDNEGVVDCNFSVNTSIYQGVKQIWSDLSKLNAYSQKTMAGIQLADTNCDVQTVKGILDLLKPPYNLDQLEFLNSGADAEAEMFADTVSQSDVQALFKASETLYWKTLYMWLLSAPIHTAQGDVTIAGAMALLDNPAVRWKLESYVSEAKTAYSNAVSDASSGDYGNAYIELEQAREYVKKVLDAGIAESGNESYRRTYVYAGAAAVALLVLLIYLRKRGGGDENNEDGLDYYSYDSYG